MPAPRTPSAVIMDARARRGPTAAGGVRWQWFTPDVLNRVNLTMYERVRVATEMLKSKIVTNLSTAVTVGSGPRGGRVVTGRSVSGEYPHAETSTLMRGIFLDIRKNRNGVVDGFIGTPHSYGLILETKMNRSFLVRTLLEERSRLGLILAAPMRDK